MIKLNKYFIFIVMIPLLVGCYPHEAPIANTIPKKALTSLPTITITPDEAYSYIDMKFPPIPNSIKTSSSWGEVISPSSSSQTWGVAVVKDSNYSMLWLSKILDHDQNGKALWQVSDIAILPPPEKDYEILISSCLLRGVLDPEIVVLARIDKDVLNNRYLLNTGVLLAWRANQSKGKLEQIDQRDIECYAETFLDYPQ